MTLSAKCGVRLTRKRNCFSSTGTTVASVAATTVALRGLWSIRAISPKMLSSGNVSAKRLPSLISTLPLLTMYNSSAGSPWRKMISPALKLRIGAPPRQQGYRNRRPYRP